MSAIRSFFFGVWLYGSIFIFGTGLLITSLIGRMPTVIGVRAWAHTVLFGLRWICGVKVEVRGHENMPEGGCLLACKHQSMLDTIAPWTFVKDPAFVLKQELLKLPFYGWVVARMQHIPIDRAGGSTALSRMMAAARRAVADDRAILIFPEGTRQEVGAKPDYKVGVAGIYKDLGAPCALVAVHTGHVWPARGLPSKPGTAVFEILPALPPGMQRAAFMREMTAKIEEASNRLAGIAPSPQSAPAQTEKSQ
jgi:1-acyl-sn-glycerol-3-phosphate acyltransferase